MSIETFCGCRSVEICPGSDLDLGTRPSLPPFVTYCHRFLMVEMSACWTILRFRACGFLNIQGFVIFPQRIRFLDARLLILLGVA